MLGEYQNAQALLVLYPSLLVRERGKSRLVTLYCTQKFQFIQNCDKSGVSNLFFIIKSFTVIFVLSYN